MLLNMVQFLHVFIISSFLFYEQLEHSPPDTL
jgi:hypothetical protein